MKKIPVNRATQAALKVLDYCGLDSPLELSLEEIALARGVTSVQPVKIDGAQGRITWDDEDAIISYDSKIELEGKRRFVIAHELGHFELHKGLLNGIHVDTEKSLNEWFATGSHETEANLFAAELLMPAPLFIEQAGKKRFDFNLIKTLSSAFKTSFTATILRYKDLGDYPLAVIYCEKKRVKWRFFTNDFCLQYLPQGMEVPINTVAIDFFDGDQLPDEPEVIDAEAWFEQDFNLKYHRRKRFYEQCFRIGKDGVLSCIWND
jgi:Zn-dependent peptidase ImmA (M78 family)